MIDFDVRRNSKYLELTIKADNINYTSGLLDESEAVDMAKKLIYAAELLLPGYGEIEHNLSVEREKL